MINSHNIDMQVCSYFVLMYSYTVMDNGTLVPQTEAEFREQQLTYVKNSGNYTKVFDASSDSSSYPESVDWRTKNAVTSVKNQVDDELGTL